MFALPVNSKHRKYM